MLFKEKVLFVRKQLLMTQDQLAKEIGVSTVTVARWESKGREPRIVSQGKFFVFCKEHGIDFKDEH